MKKRNPYEYITDEEYDRFMGGKGDIKYVLGSALAAILVCEIFFYIFAL